MNLGGWESRVGIRGSVCRLQSAPECTKLWQVKAPNGPPEFSMAGSRAPGDEWGSVCRFQSAPECLKECQVCGWTMRKQVVPIHPHRASGLAAFMWSTFNVLLDFRAARILTAPCVQRQRGGRFQIRNSRAKTCTVLDAALYTQRTICLLLSTSCSCRRIHIMGI